MKNLRDVITEIIDSVSMSGDTEQRLRRIRQECAFNTNNGTIKKNNDLWRYWFRCATVLDHAAKKDRELNSDPDNLKRAIAIWDSSNVSQIFPSGATVAQAAVNRTVTGSNPVLGADNDG